MHDLRSILADHRSRNKHSNEDQTIKTEDVSGATTSEIPDIFFDQILVNFKMTRIEIMVLMYLYRQVWCRPNLYKIFGISQLMSHTEMANFLDVDMHNIHSALSKLEGYGFINTIRSGQYFVRKYFLKENDELFAQNYDDFDM